MFEPEPYVTFTANEEPCKIITHHVDMELEHNMFYSRVPQRALWKRESGPSGARIGKLQPCTMI